MIGLRFVRGEHLSVAEGVFLPSAAIPELIWKHLAESTAKPLRPFTPDPLKSDFIYFYDTKAAIFAFFLSPRTSAALPTWGARSDFFQEYHAAGITFLAEGQDCTEITGSRLANDVFAAFDFEPGPALVGRFPSGYGEEVEKEQLRMARAAAGVIWSWAERERLAVEESGIFLSHRGIDKPLVEKIDQSLRMLNLKSWLDKHDLPVGVPLVRGVDAAFGGCSAAVFFISGEYQDEGVIAAEVDRAIHESALRPDGFKIIPLVLQQHGGTDANVPAPLRKLRWETVQDVDIMPTIIRSLPPRVQATIRFVSQRV
jgi:hypothetical protein